MQAKDLKGSQEILCISTDKVYDWIVNEATFDITQATVTITEVTADNVASVSCEVTNVVISEVPDTRVDRDVTINGTTIELQEVTLQKVITFTVTATLTTGTEVTSVPITVTRFERVLLCAPEGTEVEAEATDLDCFIDAFTPVPGELTAVSLSVRICQDIRVLFPVVLEIEADFCEPRGVLPTGVCPPIARPLQCPVLFPDNE